MSILWRMVFFSRCTSTHHKLALDALRFVRGPQSDLWANLFLSNHEQYLTGSKAPDNEFRDFKNHVLHVEDGFWGGATTSAREWYQKTVSALSQGEWPEAIYNAGVLSHYFTDPFQPFHTGQTEAEGKVHRAAEWSICKSYEDLQAILEQDLSGYPECELPARPDWLEEAIRQGALTAHESYTVCVEHYDLNRGIKDPPSGLDQEMKDRLARLIGLATVGFSRVLERAFEESGASPPDVAVSLHVLLAGMKVPLNWIRRKFTDLRERAVVEAIYLEVQDKGKAVESLPEDERTVRKQYAQEVLKIPVRQLDAEPAGATGTKYGTGKPSRGETIKAASSASFQRTVISSPRQFDTQRGPAAPLETCLMVPLAKEPPPDIVADVAVRAYLKAQQPVEQHVPVLVPSGQPSPIVSADRNLMPMSSRSTETPQSAVPMSPRPTIAEPAAASKSELDKAERRLQRQLNRQTDPEPPLMPPSLPVALANDTQGSLATAEMPVDMFAPLPPMPRVAPREKIASAAVQASNPISAMPTERIPVVVPPARSAPQVAVQSSGTAAPPARPAQSPVRTVPQQSITPTANPSRDAKVFSAQPAAPSVIPAPHVRLPEAAEDNASFPVELKNRLTAEGQSAGFDFRNFSGVTPPATAFQSTAVPAPKPTPPTPLTPPNPAAAAMQRPAATPQHAQTTDHSASRRFYLELHSPVVDAPSIGPKTAERMHSIGIHTIADLLKMDPGQAAEKLGNRAATDLVRDWQDQSRLVCCVPNLRGHDAQFLVACQVRTTEQLRTRDPRQLLQQVETFLGTTTGQRLLRGGRPPDLAEVTEWIVAAREARSV